MLKLFALGTCRQDEIKQLLDVEEYLHNINFDDCFVE